MKKLLYISYLFPPVGGSGVQRSLKFARYLPDNGWEPIMLVANHRFLKQTKDYSLSRNLPSELLIYRCFAPDMRWVFKILWGLKLNSVVNWLLRNCLIPDAEVLWLPFAKHALNRIFKRHMIDLVLITAPPYTPLFLGKYIKRKYGIDYVVDLRDPWTIGSGRQFNPLPDWLSKTEKHWERSILDIASKVVCVNRLITERIMNEYPAMGIKKFETVNNGYDENDFVSCPLHQKGNKLSIIYTGTFYDSRQPEIIWDAIMSLVNKGAISPSKIRFKIYGHNNHSFVLGRHINNQLLSSIIEIHPYRNHKQAIELICLADVVLVYSGFGVSEAMNSPAKLYEYMRCSRPILAVIDPTGEAANLLKPAGTCFLADSSKQDSVENTLFTIYQYWEEDKLVVSPDFEYIRQFERRSLTAKLSNILDEAAKQ